MKKYGIKIKSIVKCNDKFLIVERWYDDRIEEPYQWEFLDTDLEDDELPETACMRVIAESMGINSARIVSMAYSWKYQLGDNNYLGLAFLCEVPDEPVMLSEELGDYKWVEVEELTDYISKQAIIDDMKQAQVI